MEELEAFRSELLKEAQESAVLSRKLGQWALSVVFLIAITIIINMLCQEMMVRGIWVIVILALVSIAAFFIFPIGKPSDTKIQKEIDKLIIYKLEWNPIVIGCAQKEIEKQQARLDEAKREQYLLSLLSEAEAVSGIDAE
jgi:hypothetical protein